MVFLPRHTCGVGGQSGVLSFSPTRSGGGVRVVFLPVCGLNPLRKMRPGRVTYKLQHGAAHNKTYNNTTKDKYEDTNSNENDRRRVRSLDGVCTRQRPVVVESP